MRPVINRIDKLRVTIVDAQPICRSGLVEVINAQPDLITGCEASSAHVALENLRNCPADLAVIEIYLPGGPNGLELIKQIRAEHPRLKILVFSIYDESAYALRSLRAGALGYVMKTEGLGEVVEALHKVANGEVFLSPKIREKLLHRSIHRDNLDDPSTLLSRKEHEVFELFGQGFDAKTIACRLNLSSKTVETYRTRIKKKMCFRDARELVRFAVDWVRRSEKQLPRERTGRRMKSHSPVLCASSSAERKFGKS